MWKITMTSGAAFRVIAEDAKIVREMIDNGSYRTIPFYQLSKVDPAAREAPFIRLAFVESVVEEGESTMTMTSVSTRR